jgi:hypothetical protein
MINAQKIKSMGTTATSADRAMLLKGLTTWVQFILQFCLSSRWVAPENSLRIFSFARLSNSTYQKVLIIFWLRHRFSWGFIVATLGSKVAFQSCCQFNLSVSKEARGNCTSCYFNNVTEGKASALL